MAESNLTLIHQKLTSSVALQQFQDSLPKASGEHATEMAKRFAKMTYTAICQNPSLQACTPQSILKAASISASLDLDIDVRGLAYLVPYKNKKNNNAMEAQFQIGYMGLIELAYRSGKVKAISAHCVYESERNDVNITRIDGRYKVIHPFSYEPTSGKIIAVYATAEIDGLGPQTMVLRIDEVEFFRGKSKAPNSPAWTEFYPAMAKKTTLRQLAKFLPKSIVEEFSRGAAIDERESFVEAKASETARIEAETGSEVVEAEAAETPNNNDKRGPTDQPAFMME